MTIVKLPGSILFSGDIKRMHTCIYHLLKNLCHVKTGYIDSENPIIPVSTMESLKILKVRFRGFRWYKHPSSRT